MNKSVITWTLPYVFHLFLAEKQQRLNSMFPMKIFTVWGCGISCVWVHAGIFGQQSALQCISEEGNITLGLLLWLSSTPFAAWQCFCWAILYRAIIPGIFLLQHQQSAPVTCSAAPQHRAASTTRNSCLIQAGKIKKPYIISYIFNIIRKNYENM